MARRVTQVHMEPGGWLHDHIMRLRWEDPETGTTGSSTVAEMVAYLMRGNTAYTLERGRRTDIIVVRTARGYPYLRTCTNNILTDNLLALPRY